MKVERDITINAPVERVWSFLMDAHKLGDWVTIQQKLKQAPSGELKEGDELTQCLRLMHKKFDVRWRVKQADEPRKAVWEGKGPVFSKAAVVYELKPDGDGACEFHYVNEFKAPGGPFGSFVADRAFQGTSEREADASLRALKRILES